ncbi:MAG: hypothetical protein GY856_35325, partial [bacterium]|nr:hypothetical protein [bacterium]
LVCLPLVAALSRGSGGRLRGVLEHGALCAAVVAVAVSPWIFRRFTDPDFFTGAVWDGLIWFLLWGFLFYGFQALLLSSLGVKIPPQWTIFSVAALCSSLAVAEPLRITGASTPLQIAVFGLLQGALVGSVQWCFLSRRLSPSWPWLVTTAAGTCVLWLFGIGDLWKLAISVTALHFVQGLCLAAFGSSRPEPRHRTGKHVRPACDRARLAPSAVDTVPSR